MNRDTIYKCNTCNRTVIINSNGGIKLCAECDNVLQPLGYAMNMKDIANIDKDMIPYISIDTGRIEVVKMLDKIIDDANKIKKIINKNKINKIETETREKEKIVVSTPDDSIISFNEVNPPHKID